MNVGDSISVRLREEGDALAAEKFEEPGRLCERSPGGDSAVFPRERDEVGPVERVEDSDECGSHCLYPLPLAPFLLGFTVEGSLFDLPPVKPYSASWHSHHPPMRAGGQWCKHGSQIQPQVQRRYACCCGVQRLLQHAQQGVSGFSSCRSRGFCTQTPPDKDAPLSSPPPPPPPKTGEGERRGHWGGRACPGVVPCGRG